MSTATQQIKELISQIEQRDFLNCAQAFLAIAEQLRILYDNKIKDNIYTLKSGVQERISRKKEEIEKLQEQLQDFDTKNKELEQRIEEGRELEAKKQDIEAANAKLKKRQSEIEILQRISVELKKPENNFITLDEQKEQILSGHEDVVKRQLEALNSFNELLEKSKNALHTELSSVIGIVSNNIQNLNNDQAQLLKQLSTDPLKSGAESLDNKVEETIASYNKYVVKIQKIEEELDRIEKEHDDIVRTYKDRYENNEAIFGELNKPVAINSYIQDSTSEMKRLLEDFEAKIRDLQGQRSTMTIPEIYNRQSGRINS